MITSLWNRLAMIALPLVVTMGPLAAQAKPVHIVIETSLGNIDADLDSARAPNSVSNFLRYVDAGLYSKGVFHRTVYHDTKPVKITVIQAGADPARRGEFFAPIDLERTSVTGLKHEDGTLSMARAGINSATNEFFICVGAQPELDFGGKRNADGQGFAAFGKVTKGMDIVRAINTAPANGETLTPPIEILRIRRR